MLHERDTSNGPARRTAPRPRRHGARTAQSTASGSWDAAAPGRGRPAGTRHSARRQSTGRTYPAAARPLAVFCFEAPDSLGRPACGQDRRRARPPQVSSSVLRATPSSWTNRRCARSRRRRLMRGSQDIFEQVQEFTSRAATPFSASFPAAAAHVTLMGYEWSVALPPRCCAASRTGAPFSPCTRWSAQRSDMTTEISQRIEEIEQTAGCARRRSSSATTCRRGSRPASGCPIVPSVSSPHASRFPSRRSARTIDPGAGQGPLPGRPDRSDDPVRRRPDERYGPDLLVKAMPASSRTIRRPGSSSSATASCTGRCASTPAICCWSTPSASSAASRSGRCTS